MRKEIEGAFRELTGAVNDWLHMHTIAKGVPYLDGFNGAADRDRRKAP